MSKNYEDYKPINPQPPRRRRNPVLTFVQYAIIFLLVVALILSAVYFISLYSKESNGDGEITAPPLVVNTDVGEETTVDSATSDETQPGPEQPGEPTPSYKYVDYSKDQINKGPLILVSSGYKVEYPSADELISLFQNRSASYMVSSNTMMIHKDVIEPLNKMLDDFVAATEKNDLIIWTSYRDEARQTEVYNNYVARYGEEAARSAVAKPGESDHHTALGVVLKVYRAGLTYEIPATEGYSWLEDNCEKYGFVVRYPNNKINVTGLDYSGSLYLRYVGIPLAEIMKKNNWCLEEFLVFIKDYTYDRAHFEYTAEDGTAYEVYYVPAPEGADVISVPVPEEKEYSVSGNNMDGFVVTAKK